MYRLTAYLLPLLLLGMEWLIRPTAPTIQRNESNWTRKGCCSGKRSRGSRKNKKSCGERWNPQDRPQKKPLELAEHQGQTQRKGVKCCQSITTDTTYSDRLLTAGAGEALYRVSANSHSGWDPGNRAALPFTLAHGRSYAV